MDWSGRFIHVRYKHTARVQAAIRFGSFEFFSGLLSDSKGADKYGLGQAKGFLAGLGAGTMEAIFVTVRGRRDRFTCV